MHRLEKWPIQHFQPPIRFFAKSPVISLETATSSCFKSDHWAFLGLIRPGAKRAISVVCVRYMSAYNRASPTKKFDRRHALALGACKAGLRAWVGWLENLYVLEGQSQILQITRTYVYATAHYRCSQSHCTRCSAGFSKRDFARSRRDGALISAARVLHFVAASDHVAWRYARARATGSK